MLRTLGSRPLTRVGVISRRSYSTVPPIYSLPVTTPDPNTIALTEINQQLVRMNKQTRFANYAGSILNVAFLGLVGYYCFSSQVKVTAAVEMDEKNATSLNQAANAALHKPTQ